MIDRMGFATDERGLTELQAFDPPELNEMQQQVVDGLRAEGIAVARFRDLFDEARWAEVQADIEPFVAETARAFETRGPKPAKKDDLIVRRYHSREEGAEKHLFRLDDPWLRTAASTTILDIVNTYRQQLTRLHYADYWFTVPYPEIEERVSSQRWHRDPEEEHVVKVFTYFSDVDEGAGPFEYVQGSATGGRYGELWAWDRDDRHPPTDELEAATAAEDRLTLTGPPGTMIFCDTGGFHRGGFARVKPRVMGTSTYVSLARGKGHRYRVDFQRREGELPDQVRAALPSE
jgi:hypothetical protein